MNSSTLDLLVTVLLINVLYDLVKLTIHQICNWNISVSTEYFQAADGNKLAKLEAKVTLDHEQLEGATIETSREAKTGKITEVVIVPKYRKD